MRTPLCNNCMDTEELCSTCKQKLDKNEITQADVNLSRVLFRLSQVHAAMEKAEFNNAVEVGNMLLVTVQKGNAGQFIGRGGYFIKQISEEIGKPIKVVEETNDPKEAVQRILFPAKFLGLNVMYNGDAESYKVRVARSDKIKVRDPESMEKAIEVMLGKKALISFE